jgi:hypothetical protein
MKNLPDSPLSKAGEMMIQVKRSFDDCCWFQNKGMIQMQSASFSQLLLAVLSFQQLYLPFDYRSCAAN